jgi:hypothetical protein
LTDLPFCSTGSKWKKMSSTNSRDYRYDDQSQRDEAGRISRECQLASIPVPSGNRVPTCSFGRATLPCLGAHMRQLPDHRLGNFPTLGYGQTHTVGAITSDSEPPGVRCTDSSTGHFFFDSRESYQLG